MKKQANSMASAHAGRGGKNKWSRSDNQEKKEKKKIQYQSSVAKCGTTDEKEAENGEEIF